MDRSMERTSSRRWWTGLVAVAALVLSIAATVARADHDPKRTATIYVHGFELDGATHSGTYGDENDEAIADSVAALAGLPTSPGGDGPLPPNVVIGVRYYGDAAPTWYSAADRAEIEAAGGGVPRYAAIVAKFARRVLARSGADQVNFVSTSFGSLVVRWLIEKDVAGLAGDRRIARWLTVEGVLGGNWAASHADASFLTFLDLDPVDVEDMSHEWIDANLHLPHSEADSPLYAGILIGQVASTDDRYEDSALSLLMAAARDWQPNDGVQALPDARFESVTARSRLLGLPPTLALFHATHFALKQSRGAWAEAATFLTQRRRVTITLTSATVANLHEPELAYFDGRPGEIVFESRVSSRAAAARWGVREPVCAALEAGAAPPLRRYARDGDTQALTQVIYDDFVLPEETALDVALRGYDVDFDPHYGVYETLAAPFLDDLGSATVAVSPRTPGSYTFRAGDWSGRLEVRITDYPFTGVTGVLEPATPADEPALAITPNPARGVQRIVVPGRSLTGASIDIVDVTGRRVRHVASIGSDGWEWDGRDDAARAVDAGVYLVRVTMSSAVLAGRTCVVR